MKSPKKQKSIRPKVVDIPPRSSDAAENSQPEPKSAPKPAAKARSIRQSPATARTELPRKELNHKVRSDIHERLDDEQYLRRKAGGERVHLAEIADEALHLGLLQIEKRRR